MLGKFIDEHQHPKIYYNWFQIGANETVRVHGRHSGDMMGNKELRLKSKYLMISMIRKSIPNLWMMKIRSIPIAGLTNTDVHPSRDYECTR